MSADPQTGDGFVPWVASQPAQGLASQGLTSAGAVPTPAGMGRGQRGACPGHGCLRGTGKGVSAQPKARTALAPQGRRRWREAPAGTGTRLRQHPRGRAGPETSERWIEPQAGGIPADRRDSRRQGVCWELLEVRGGFPCRSLWETAQGGEGRGNSPSAWPGSPRGKSPGGRQSFPVCALISIAGACPRAEVRGRLSRGSTSASLGQSSVTHVPGLWGQRDPRWAPRRDTAAGPAVPAASAREGAAGTTCLRLRPRSLALCPQGGQRVPSSRSQEFHLPSQPQERVPLLPASGCHGAEPPVGDGAQARAGISLSFLPVQGATPGGDGTGPRSSQGGSTGGCRGAGRSSFVKNLLPPLSK